MFASFFPNPRLLFPSVILWTVICIAAWYLFARDLGHELSLWRFFRLALSGATSRRS